MQPAEAAHGYDPYTSDTGGWFSDAVSSVGHAVSSAAKTVTSVAKTASKVAASSIQGIPLVNYTPLGIGLTAAKTIGGGLSAGLAGRNIYFGARGAGLSALSKQLHSYGRDARNLTTKRGLSSIMSSALPVAQQMLGTNPFGMVANAGLSAMATGLKGGNLTEIAMAAASGAIPDSIEAAINIATDALRGKNILKSALTQAAKNFVPGSTVEQGFRTAQAVLSGANVSKQALGFARSQLGDEGARRAFDSAVGTAAKAAKVLRKSPLRFTAAVPARRSRPVVAYRPLSQNVGRFVAQFSPRTPWGALFGRDTGALEENGAKYRVVSGDSPWKISQTITGAGNRWKELVAANPSKPRAKDGSFKFLNPGELLTLPASWLTFTATTPAAETTTATTTTTASAPAAAPASIGGLEQGGTRYRVIDGDNPSKIALKLTGQANRWQQLIAANPSKPTDPKTGNFKTLWAGELLIVPNSWRKTTTTTPAATTTAASASAMLQARAILIAWAATDGAREAGIDGYGNASEDSAATWGARDRLMCKSFCNWRNRQKRTALPVSGDLTDAVMIQLQAWAKEYAAAEAASHAPTVSTTPAVTVPTVVPTVTLPTVVPSVVPTVAPPVVTVPTIPTVSVSTPAPIPVTPAASTPAEIVQLVAVAISSGNSPTMLSLASTLDGRGYPVEAAALRGAAAENSARAQPAFNSETSSILSNALLIRNPSQMRASASALRAKGYTREAAALESAALALAGPATAAKSGGGDGLIIGALALAALKALAVI
jgi:nucleoid-associated protein YgaU